MDRRNTVAFVDPSPPMTPTPSTLARRRSTIVAKRRPIKKCLQDRDFWKSFFSFFLLVIWLVAGMWIFHLVEYPAEVARNKSTTPSPTTTPINNQLIEIDLTQFNMTTALKFVFQQFVDGFELVSINETTMIVKRAENTTIGNYLDNQPSKHCDSGGDVAKWDLSGSIFFCITVVTTIGYGNYAPHTETGQVICVIFAVIGIPLNLIVISNMSKLLTRFADRMNRCWNRITKRIRKTSTNAEIMAMDEDDLSRIRKIDRRRRRFSALVSALCITAIGTLIFLFMPALAISSQEGWDYVTALYYGFITLSTIGFGDYVAGQQGGHLFELYRLFLSIWIFLGMAFIATFITIVQQLIDKMTKGGVTRISTRISTAKFPRPSRFSIMPRRSLPGKLKTDEIRERTGSINSGLQVEIVQSDDHLREMNRDPPNYIEESATDESRTTHQTTLHSQSTNDDHIEAIENIDNSRRTSYNSYNTNNNNDGEYVVDENGDIIAIVDGSDIEDDVDDGGDDSSFRYSSTSDDESFYDDDDDAFETIEVEEADF